MTTHCDDGCTRPYIEEDVSCVIARHLVAVDYEDLPSEVVTVTKRSILDILGAILGASGTIPGCRKLAELVKEAGGKEESTIIGFGGKVPAWMAAFVNGAMAHCLDYDDTHDLAMMHTSAPTVPPGFAVAERLGNISGKEFITAVALGEDLACRMALAVISPTVVWHPIALLGVFASTATCAKLLGLDEERIVDAFGIALCQAAGTMELGYGTGSDLRGMYNAFSGKGGVLSALMSHKGITGMRTSLEGRAGFFNAYYQGQYNREALISDLGKRYENVNIAFKPWPSCRATHPYIEATLWMMREYDIGTRDIEEVVVYVGDFSRNLCEPLEARQKPATALDAKLSIPFTVGTAIAKGKIVIDDFTPDGLRNVEALKLAEKVTPKFDAQLSTKGLPPAIVEMRTINGKEYSKRIDIPYGHPQNPMSMEEFLNKFMDCASHSAKQLPKENVEDVIHLIDKLEEVDDVGQVMRLLG